MTKIIITFEDEKGIVLPKAMLQPGRTIMIRLLDVKPENRYEEIHMRAVVHGWDIKGEKA